MNDEKRVRRLSHRHRPVATRAIVQRSGIPYEHERICCSVCGRELEHRTLKRAAA